MSKTIKEIYGEELIIRPETALLKHFNLILTKTPNDLTVNDVCMLIRQEFFVDMSIPKAIEIIREKHSAGDNYDYCLLVNLSEMEASFKDYKKSVADLISILEKDYPSTTFELDDDREDYLNSIKRLKSKINSL